MVDCVATHWLDRLVIGHMRGPDHPGKLRLCRWTLRALHGETVEMRLGNACIVHVPFEDYIGHAILMQGRYEPMTLALADRLLEGGGTFVDVGANFGLFSAYVARHEGVRVLAVEPDPVNFLRLRRNCEGLDPARCALVHGLAGAESGLLPVSEPDPRNRGKVRIAGPGAGAEDVSFHALAAPLDGILGAAGVDRIDLIKIDVEGYEWQVLAGCPFEGPARPRNVILELSDQGLRFGSGRGARDLVAFFSERGYEFLTVAGDPAASVSGVPEHNAWFRDRQPEDSAAGGDVSRCD